jgi:uncharacterized protein (TIGR02466 family)
MIIDIFKTSIYKTSINNLNHYNFFINLLNECLDKNEGRVRTNRGGFQTKGFDLQNIDNNNIFNDVFIDPVLNFLNSFKIKKEFKLTNCYFWINKNYQNSFNVRHIHGNNVISGVYYLEAPTYSGNIVFENSDNLKLNSNYLDKFEDPNFYTHFITDPKKFDLILFFGETIHRVEPNLSNEDRISVSFNIDIN